MDFTIVYGVAAIACGVAFFLALVNGEKRWAIVAGLIALLIWIFGS